ncbi:inovirus-type Gp2 protein [Burkholderia pseudomallei]|uniref:inovirus-type Gp2 protein n=1 Tax=Burkholderia pseudomallei TaxID=28450 RepID=UPI001AD6D968|nr:inovirus-type Gp2 protein [Burkholderia pseudomallei]MBO7771589.1 inovirus-type Gp2 protein [Burkholderia pseudomallei]MBO7905632.1 inovirus-type Gp2 protein [Burkholderia pseudomallei]
MYQNNEDREALEVIAHLNERTCLEQTDIDGKRTTIIHKGYTSQHLFKIEKFVIEIEKRGEAGFVEEATGDRKAMKILGLNLGKRYYGLLNDWLERYSDRYRYSARVEVFYDVCKELGFIGEYPFSFEAPGEVASEDGSRYMDLFNTLIEHIRMRCQSREFKERERLRLANAEKNKQNVLALEEAMFAEETGRSRWLVLSLTLRYRPEFRDVITLETIQQHRDRFFAARRFNKLISGIKNFVWTIEQGEKSGLHLHVILFYSTEHNHDEHIAKQIGEYWVNVVTEGRGDYWNSNDRRKKKNYETRGHGIGVGQIDRKDDKKRSALRTNLVYLAKAAQYLMIKGAERIRTFDMGQVPTKVKAGRPRADVGASSATENPIEVESDSVLASLDEPRGD